MRRRKRTGISTTLLALLFAGAVTPSVQALFDPGEPTKHTDQMAEQKGNGPHVVRNSLYRDAPSVKYPLSTDLVPLIGEPVSLHPGCRRMTDLFDNVCPNPWTPWSHSSPLPRSELVICPLPSSGSPSESAEATKDPSRSPRERVYAITGTITLPNHLLDDTLAGEGSLHAKGVPPPTHHHIGDRPLTGWPQPGDEGFWRQRDGELEWVPTEPRALLEEEALQGTSPAPHLIPDDGAPPPPEQLAEAVQAKEYDAWSERIGGEDSETWLSFEEWRDKHLAAEREKAEQERQRLATNKKNKHDKQKDARSHTATGQQSQHSEATESPTPSPAPLAEQASPRSDAGDTHSYLDSISDSAVASQDVSPAAYSQDRSADTVSSEGADMRLQQGTDAWTVDQGAVPALGNPSDELANLKHRWNFASLDCAAVVHRTNPSAKFASSILSEKKDRYMLSPCPASTGEHQFVIVELCDEIKIDTLVMANFEFFSRMFKRFRVHVSRNLNGGDDEWVDIGTFRARNVRGLQVFKTVNPSGDARFFRYVRIDFMEHYGSEYYCPLSLLRIYGLTQMDDYIREEEELRKAREAENQMLQDSSAEDEEEPEQEAETAESDIDKSSIDVEPSPSSGQASNSDLPSATSQPVLGKADNCTSDATESARTREYITGNVQQAGSNNVGISDTINSNKTDVKTGALQSDITSVTSTKAGQAAAAARPFGESSNATGDVVSSERIRHNSTQPAMPSSTTPHHAIQTEAGSRNDTTQDASQTLNGTVSSSSPIVGAANTSMPQYHGGSESIYRTITKRLNVLEANATLSIQYFDHSRQMLRETFARMERNQRDKIGQMLRELNASNWRQIESLKRRQQVDLQQALFEFDMHRQQTDAERRALLAQVHLLSNEVMLEKRFGIAQLILLLGLFVFMALTRGSRAAPLINEGLARMSRSSSIRLNDKRRGSSLDSTGSESHPSTSLSLEQAGQGNGDVHGWHGKKDYSNRGSHNFLPRSDLDVRTSSYRLDPIRQRMRGPLDGRLRRHGGASEYAVRMRGGINAKVPLQRRGRTLVPLVSRDAHNRTDSVDASSQLSEEPL